MTIEHGLSAIVHVGQVLYGYCGGHFGRDGLGPKRIEVIGPDFIVVRLRGHPVLTSFSGIESTSKVYQILRAWVADKGPDDPEED